MVTSLAIARYRFTFTLQSPMALPFFSGSLLRGAFGHALRSISCLTGIKECKSCPLYQSCLYTSIFEPPPKAHSLQKLSQAPGCYVVEPPTLGQKELAGGETLNFNMVLWGKALEQLPLVILAWQRAGRQGLGRERTKAELMSVSLTGKEEQTVWHVSSPVLAGHSQQVSVTGSAGESVCLLFSTPLRLQDNGRPLHPDSITARALLMTLVRRVSLVGDMHLNIPLVDDSRSLSLAADDVRLEHDLRWCDWERYSSRQKQKMALGGVVGSLRLAGNIEPFREFLHLGQWLHFGKNSSFGMGRYTLQQAD